MVLLGMNVTIDGLELEMNDWDVLVVRVVLTVLLSWGRKVIVVCRRRPLLLLFVFTPLKAEQIPGASSRVRHVFISNRLVNLWLCSARMYDELLLSGTTCLLKLALRVHLFLR